LISEILYDGPGADGPSEFIELSGPPGAWLNGMVLRAVNGSNGRDSGRIELLGQRIPYNGAFLIASDEAEGTLRDIADLLNGAADLQNGPDSLVLEWNGVAIDALAYGEFSLEQHPPGEGNPAPDVSEASLSRDEVLSDTDDTAADFHPSTETPLGLPTPGGARLPQIHLALRWALDATDMDLHLTRVGGSWGSEDDLHWDNRTPDWDGERGDPRLELDDTDGLGPEFIDYISPAEGAYLLQVHYYDATEESSPLPCEAQVGVYVDGALAYEGTQTLAEGSAYWAVGSLQVNAEGISFEAIEELREFPLELD